MTNSISMCIYSCTFVRTPTDMQLYGSYVNAFGRPCNVSTGFYTVFVKRRPVPFLLLLLLHLNKQPSPLIKNEITCQTVADETRRHDRGDFQTVSRRFRETCCLQHQGRYIEQNPRRRQPLVQTMSINIQQISQGSMSASRAHNVSGSTCQPAARTMSVDQNINQLGALKVVSC